MGLILHNTSKSIVKETLSQLPTVLAIISVVSSRSVPKCSCQVCGKLLGLRPSALKSQCTGWDLPDSQLLCLCRVLSAHGLHILSSQCVAQKQVYITPYSAATGHGVSTDPSMAVTLFSYSKTRVPCIADFGGKAAPMLAIQQRTGQAATSLAGK